jgi:hypothetical protein
MPYIQLSPEKSILEIWRLQTRWFSEKEVGKTGLAFFFTLARWMFLNRRTFFFVGKALSNNKGF